MGGVGGMCVIKARLWTREMRRYTPYARGNVNHMAARVGVVAKDVWVRARARRAAYMHHLPHLHDQAEVHIRLVTRLETRRDE